jgi:hypothetical protein
VVPRQEQLRALTVTCSHLGMKVAWSWRLDSVFELSLFFPETLAQGSEFCLLCPHPPPAPPRRVSNRSCSSKST